jgi:broad specificity phosphatase PhoE
MPAIHLVRHGQASFGAADYDQLSLLGHQQAQLLGDWLARIRQPVGQVVCGRLKRHQQTAASCLARWLAEDVAPGWAEDAGFDEFDYREILARSHPELAEPGALERHLKASANARRDFQAVFAASVQRWMAGHHDGEYLESWPQFRRRCIAALERHAEAMDERDMWVFTSGGPIAAIVQHVLGLSDLKMLDLNWRISNASVTRITLEFPGYRLGAFNLVSHLKISGDPNLVTYR